MPNVLFRCDGGPEIGLGHVMRCRALSEAFRDQGWGSAYAMSQASAMHFGDDDPIVVPDGVAGAEATRAILNERHGACLVVDHYGLDAEFERRAATAGTVTIAIDDLADRPHACDLLIDANPARTPADYAELTSARLLLGAPYAPLRPEFVALRRAPKAVPAKAERLLVTLGGADPGNVTSRLIEVVPQFNWAGLATTVVVGRANPRRAQLVERGRALGVDVIADPSNLVALMAVADIAISGAGVTCLEFACLGVPNVALILAANQREIARTVSEAGAVRILDACDDLEPRLVVDAVLALASDAAARTRMSSAGQVLIDGKGAARVAAEAARLHALRKLEKCH
jgi:UDP-2,4-diacetamido-2,4,6-trideoxy-beta-L-altropyranose hydrolase